MRWLTRGMCGIDLRKHTYIVAAFDILFSVAGIVMGFVVIVYPENYVSGYPPNVIQLATTEIPTTIVDVNSTIATTPAAEQGTNITANLTTAMDTVTAKTIEDAANDLELDEGVFVTTEQFHFVERVKALQNQVVEGLITAMVTVIVTLALIYGVKSGKSVYFLPWLTENMTGLVVSFGVSCVRLMSGTTGSVIGSLIFMFLVIPLYAYLVYGVASLFVMFRRMKRHTREIISSVMQGSSAYRDGVNFEQLHEELSKEMNLTPIPAALQMHSASANGMTTMDNSAQNPPTATRRDDIMYFSI